MAFLNGLLSWAYRCVRREAKPHWTCPQEAEYNARRKLATNPNRPFHILSP